MLRLDDPSSLDPLLFGDKSADKSSIFSASLSSSDIGGIREGGGSLQSSNIDRPHHSLFHESSRELSQTRPHLPFSGGIYDQYGAVSTALSPEKKGKRSGKSKNASIMDTIQPNVEIPQNQNIKSKAEIERNIGMHFKQGWTLSKVNLLMFIIAI